MAFHRLTRQACVLTILATGVALGSGPIAAQTTRPAASEVKTKAIAAEQARFQGTWQLISAETNGKKLPDEQAKLFKVVIVGEHHTVMFGDKVVARQVKFVIDPTATPKTTEDTLDEGPDAGKKIRGIYILEGDELTSCVAGIDKPRPTEFTGRPGSEQTLRKFKRVANPTASKPSAVEEANAKEYAAFEGTWRIVSMRAQGKELPVKGFETSRLVCKGRDFTTTNDEGTSHGQFKVDTSQSPKTMEITITDGPAKGATFLGIYELTGDKYKLCGNLNGKGERPKEFDSKPGSGYVLQMLERVKP